MNLDQLHVKEVQCNSYRICMGLDNHEDNLIHVDCKVLVCPRLMNGLHECEESTKTGY